MLIIPPEVERIICFKLKYIPHYYPEPLRVITGFEELKRTCRNRLYFHGKDKDPQLLPVILKKLYQPTNWEIEEEDQSPRLEMALNQVEAYLRETLAASLTGHKLPKNPAFSAVKTWITQNSCIVKITDKNLGAAVLSLDWYNEQIEKPLSTSTYRLIPDESLEETWRSLTTKSDDITKLPRNKYIRKFLRW